jgi:nucleoside-diphosphate-sugar epimerase
MVAPGQPAEFHGTTLLVTGGCGYLGRAVIADLLPAFPGKIVGVCSCGGGDLPPPHQRLRADVRDVDRWRELLTSADYVLWMAAMRDHSASAAATIGHNVSPIRAATAALRSSDRLRRFVYVSSISAVDQPPYPEPPVPIVDTSPPNPHTPYGQSKLVAELSLRASGLPHTILRLPFLYGPGFRRGSFLDFYRRVATSPVYSRMRFTGRLSLLYTGDVAGLSLEIMRSGNAAAADASPYVVSDGRVYSVDDLISMVARLHGRHRPPVRVPDWLAKQATNLTARSRAMFQPGPVRRGRLGVLAAYWSHAAFDDTYFTVNPSRFMAAFPQVTFTPLDAGFARAFATTSGGSCSPL